MRKYLILMSCSIICVFLCSTISHAAKFTFNNLAPDDDIGAYMTGIYGSEVVVKGATTSQSGNPGDGIYLTNLGENPDYNYIKKGLTFDFSAPVSKLVFISSNNSHVDNLSVTPETEPATMLLLGFGLVGITTYSRRKIKNQCRPSQKSLNLGYIRAELS